MPSMEPTRFDADPLCLASAADPSVNEKHTSMANLRAESREGRGTGRRD